MNKSTIDQVYVKELDTLFDINDIRVPSVGTGDAGKTLSVGSDGKYTLAEQSASVSSLTDVEIGTLADGQILQYDETSGKWVNAENSGGVQSDWNQNDSTAPDYIKNRTHWTEQTVTHTGDVLDIVQNGGLTVSSGTSNGVTHIMYHGYDTYALYGETGENGEYSDYEFVINGRTYYARMNYIYTYEVNGTDLTLYDIYTGNEPESSLSSDMYIVSGSWTPSEDMDMYLDLYFPSTVLSSVTSFVIKQIGGEVHQLDRKYIPFENSDWQQNDATAVDFIKNRTHWKYQSGSSDHNLANLNGVTFETNTASGVMRIRAAETTAGNGALDWLVKDDANVSNVWVGAAASEWDEYEEIFVIDSPIQKSSGTTYPDDIPYYGIWKGNGGAAEDEYGSDYLYYVYNDGTSDYTVTSDMYWFSCFNEYPSGKYTVDLYLPASNVTGNYFEFYISQPNYAYHKLDIGYIPISGTNDGTNWTSLTLGNETMDIAAVSSISSLTDVAIGTLSDGDVLTYDQTQGVWIGTAASGGTSIIMRTWTNS